MKTPTLLKRATVALDEIEVEDRLRPVSEAGVESLIASFTELGVMKDPIHLRQKKGGKLVLLAGAHRLEMARRLGWAEIEAKIWTDVTDDWAKLMEIDDNLAGAEMNALDTAVFLAERKKIHEKLHPETKRGLAGAVGRWDATDSMSVASFSTATAEKFGMTDRHVRRLIAAGSALNKVDLQQLRAAPKPITLADLQVIAKSSSRDEHNHIVEALSEGKAKSAGAARAAFAARSAGVEVVVKDPVEDQYLALVKSWTRAGVKARKRFLLEMGKEVWTAQNAGAPLMRWFDASDPADHAADEAAA